MSPQSRCFFCLRISGHQLGCTVACSISPMAGGTCQKYSQMRGRRTLYIRLLYIQFLLHHNSKCLIYIVRHSILTSLKPKIARSLPSPSGIGGTRFISFEGRHWHNDCFLCSSCKTSMVGKGFITDNEDILCPECAKKRLMADAVEQ